MPHAGFDRSIGLGFRKFLDELKKSQPTEVDATKHWAKADLSYKFWDVQKRMAEVLRSSSSLTKLLNCSRRLRKTSTVLSLCIEDCLTYDDYLIRYIAPTKVMIRKIIKPIMTFLCKDAPIHLRPIWKSQDGLYFFPSTGSELHIYGVNNGHQDDPRGTAAHRAVVDEAQLVDELKYVVHDVLMPQLITTGGQLWMMLTPPKTPAHECVEFIQREQTKVGSYAEYDIHQSEYPPDVIEKFCEEAGGPSSTTWMREYLCKLVVDTNYSLAPEWKDDFIGTMPVSDVTKFYYRYEGMDIGVRHNTVNLYATYDFRKAKLFVQGETVMGGPQMTTEKLAKEVKAKEIELWPDGKGGAREPTERVSDNSNLILLQDLGALHGLHFGPTTKDTLEAMVNNVRLWVSSGRLVVDPSCVQLIGCLKYGVWNDKRTDFETSKFYGHFDAFAALMYMLRYVDQNSNPIPANYNVDQSETFVVKRLQKEEDESIAAIGRALGIKRRGR